MRRVKGIGLPITHIIEGGYTIEEVQKALAEKLRVISTKDFPSLTELFYNKGGSTNEKFD